MSYSIEWFGDLPDDDETLIDCGGGMLIPLRELVESAEETAEDPLHDRQAGEQP